MGAWAQRRQRYLEAKDELQRVLARMNQWAERGEWTNPEFLALKERARQLVEDL